MATRIGTGVTSNADAAAGTIAGGSKSTTAGSTLTHGTGWENPTTPTHSSTADTALNSYSTPVQVVHGSGEPHASMVFAQSIVANASNVVTTTFSAATATFRRTNTEEWGGLGSTGTDGGSGATGSGTSTTYTTANITTTSPGLVVGFIKGFSALSSQSGTPGNPDFTIGITNSDVFGIYLLSTTGQVVTPGASATAAGATEWAMVAIALKDNPTSAASLTFGGRLRGPGGVVLRPMSAFPKFGAAAGTTHASLASDTITFSDSATAFINAVANASDSVTFSDSATAFIQAVAQASDSIAFSDAATAFIQAVAQASDSITFSDSAVASHSAGHFASASDSITFSDSAVAVINAVAQASDSITFSDAATALINAVANASDSVTFSDSAIAVINAVAQASDSITFSDSAVASHGSGVHVSNASDSITFSDSAVAVKVPYAPIVTWSAADPGTEIKKKREKKVREDLDEVIAQFEHKVEAIIAAEPEVAEPVQRYARGMIEHAQIDFDIDEIESHIAMSVSAIVENAVQQERGRKRQRREKLLLWI